MASSNRKNENPNKNDDEDLRPVLLMIYLWSREQKWYRVSTTFLLISRMTGIAVSV